MKPILLAALSTGFLFAQGPPDLKSQADLKFEVASVRPSQASPQDRVDIGLHMDGAQMRINSFPLRDYIARAYRVKVYQVTGPEWITSEKYDVSAKLPAGSTAEQIPEMLQALLTERFHLKLHQEKKDLPVYALILGKSPLKLQESAPDAPGTERKAGVNVAASGSAAGVSVDLGNGSYYTFANGTFEAKKITMDLFARQLERYVDRPILDMTGLKGNYDLSFNVTAEDAQTMMIHVAVNAGVQLPPEALQLLDSGSIGSLLEGLQKLGLRLDQRRAPLDLLVVDQGLKTPIEN
jgi:uncharacterized protein (TIGR03435 family)